MVVTVLDIIESYSVCDSWKVCLSEMYIFVCVVAVI